MITITKSRYFVPVLLLMLAALVIGCAGRAEQAQSLSEPPPPATSLPAVVASALTASPLPTEAPALTDSSNSTTAPAPAPSSTATASPTLVPAPATTVPSSYRVSFVTEDDKLNVREGAGIDFDVITTLPPDATDVLITSDQPEDDWVEISWLDINGWVSRYFLTEMVDPAVFCNDPAAQEVANMFRSILAASDGAMLASITHPQRGLLVRVNWWNNEVRYDHQEIATLFEAGELQDWGFEDGSGEPIEGDFRSVIGPILDKDFAVTPQIHCNDLAAGGTAGIIQLPFEYQAVNYYALYRPAQDNEFDWGTWVLGIEYWDGKPYLSFLVHYQWEI